MKPPRKRAPYNKESKRNPFAVVSTEAGRRAKNRGLEKESEELLRAALNHPVDRHGRSVTSHVLKKIAAERLRTGGQMNLAGAFEYVTKEFLGKLTYRWGDAITLNRLWTLFLNQIGMQDSDVAKSFAKEYAQAFYWCLVGHVHRIQDEYSRLPNAMKTVEVRQDRHGTFFVAVRQDGTRRLLAEDDPPEPPMLAQAGSSIHAFVTILKQHGRAAVVLPDNVLFEGGAGETIRRALLKQADVHTLLRLPTGIFYAQGVKANVLFFDRKPAQEKPWTQKLWIYDLRTNLHFTLKENTLKRSDLDDFVKCFNPKNRHTRKESERFKGFAYDDLVKRDKVNLDIFWLKDDALEESANLPAPEIIAQEISDDLEAALEQFATIADDLKK